MNVKEIIGTKNKGKKKHQKGETLIVAILGLCAILGGVLLSGFGEEAKKIQFTRTSGDKKELQTALLDDEIELPTF